MKSRTLTNSAFALALAALSFNSSACSVAPRAGSDAAHARPGSPALADAPRHPPDFDEYLRADFAPADGFDFPFGDGDGGGSYTDPATGKRHDGWYVATRFAERQALMVTADGTSLAAYEAPAREAAHL